MLELALLTPVLTLLLVGMLDLGRAVFIRNSLSNATRDAARFAIVDPANTACIRNVATYRDSFANLAPSDITVSTPGGVDLDRPVTVTARTTYRPLIGVVTQAIGLSSIELQANTTMWIRNVADSSVPCPSPTPQPMPTPSWPVRLSTPVPTPTPTP